MSDSVRGDFRIQIAPCNVTGEHTKVISVLAGTLDIDHDDGSKESLEVWVAYSKEGLEIMQHALDAAPLPVELPTVDGIRLNTKYQWTVEFKDGTILDQFPGDHHFGEFSPHDVIGLWIEPKEPSSELPCYHWSRSDGFFRAANRGADYEKLDLPWPAVPCHLEYQRRSSITFACGPYGGETLPTHVRHELGWRVDTLHGDDCETTFIIAIEDDDGSWQICKQEPAESRHFAPREPVAAVLEDGPRRVIQGEVFIVDALGGKRE